MLAPAMNPLWSKLILMNFPYKTKTKTKLKQLSIKQNCPEIFIATSTYKTRGVVILHSLCISKDLQDGVGLQQLCLQLSAATGMVGATGHVGKVLDDFLGVLSLPSTRLSPVCGEGDQGYGVGDKGMGSIRGYEEH